VPVHAGPEMKSVMQSFGAVRARLLTIDAESSQHADSHLTLGDLRVQGQSAALRDYVRRYLRFPAP